MGLCAFEHPWQALPIRNPIERLSMTATAPAIDNVAYLSDPTDPKFRQAMKRKCELCGAKPGRPCWNTIDDAAPLPGRLIHHARVI